jgi:hypothetical protein
MMSTIMVVLHQLAPTACCQLGHDANNMLDNSEDELGVEIQLVVECVSLNRVLGLSRDMSVFSRTI